MSEPFECWAILELMGHVRVGGKVSEEERFGVKMGRIEIPNAEGGFTTTYFGGTSVYRLTPCGEAEARAVAARSQPQPVHVWEMPRALPETPCGPATYIPHEDEPAALP